MDFACPFERKLGNDDREDFVDDRSGNDCAGYDGCKRRINTGQCIDGDSGKDKRYTGVRQKGKSKELGYGRFGMGKFSAKISTANFSCSTGKNIDFGKQTCTGNQSIVERHS